MRILALVVLYGAVALLVSVPPILASVLSGMCMNPTGGPCRAATMDDWFKGELVVIWMPPLLIAIGLIWVIFRLHRSVASDT